MPSQNEITEALSALLPDDEWTGCEKQDICTAVRQICARQRENKRLGGILITALREQGMSWREVEMRTEIPARTAKRWMEGPLQPAADE